MNLWDRELSILLVFYVQQHFRQALRYGKISINILSKNEQDYFFVDILCIRSCL